MERSSESVSQNYNVNIFSILDYYISSGKFLNDKERSINNDLYEIHEFFKPIDKVFGDYETRKKFGLDKELYRKDEQGKLSTIKRSDLNKKRGQLITFTVLSVDNEFRVNIGWISPRFIRETLDNIREKIENSNQDNHPVFEFYILDPVKLYQMIELDDSRNISFKKALIDRLEINMVGMKEDEIKIYLDTIEKFVQFRLEGIGGSFNQIYNDLVKGQTKKRKNNIEKIYAEFIENRVKIKNFEKFEDIKLRLGRYDDGRYVIFMHPYNSETNCPGRIPND